MRAPRAGRVQEARARLRFRNGGKRGLKRYLAPFRADLDVRPDLSDLVGRRSGLRPGGAVT